MIAAPRSARLLDHLVLPVAELSAARNRLTQLGFTVAADAQHPFGTENACVSLADKTYLEPIAVASREDCEAAALGGIETRFDNHPATRAATTRAGFLDTVGQGYIQCPDGPGGW